ncbi:hypothetical protein OEZ85_011074 [Tetradesmus obliquus]|uniref:Uncharacterized protein n=1 Tax=Tetradesmus obliquus TaxID=3088 RepID=A0ABY8TPV2_TETOB|nr:hypothetical protein OEZ85_011074 [Tetradesmus obliquus]
MDALIQVRSSTTDAELFRVLDAMPHQRTRRSYVCKLTKLRQLIDSFPPQYAACSMSAVILGDVHTVSRWLQQADPSSHLQAVEAILVMLKHAYPLLTPALRARFQRAWRQGYAAARESFEQRTAVARQEASHSHEAKVAALKAAIGALPKGDQDRCLLITLLRLGGRLSDRLILRLGNMRVYDSTLREEAAAPDADVLEDFVFVGSGDDDDAPSYLAFRQQQQQQQGAITQRGGYPYNVPASFQKRLRAAIRVALEAGGQSSVSYQDLLAIARSKDAAVEEAVKGIARALGSS